MPATYDAIIIGTGQSGPALANRLTRAGSRVAVIERKRFGGTCVNTGCIPTKTLVASAQAAHVARRAADFGVVLEGPVQVDMKRVKARKDAVVRRSNEGVEGWLRGMANCTVYTGHARFEGPRSVRVGDELLEAEKIFINVGGRAAIPPIPGLDAVPYLTNSSMMDVDFLPGAPDHPGWQLYRARIRPDVSAVRQRGDGDRADAALDRPGGRGRLRGDPPDPRGGGRADPDRRRVSALRSARRQDRRAAHRRRQLRGGRGLASPGGDGPPAEHRRPRSGQGRRGDRRARLHQGRRQAADQCSRHLGDGRLQRSWRLHPYLLQRLRDHRRQPARRRSARCRRSNRRLCPVHRPAAGACRADRGAGAWHPAGRC